MKIMVFDVPAVHGGALSILEDYYDKALEEQNGVEWIFVVSKPKLVETERIKVLRYPWIKKSWGHRLFFDYFVAPNLVRKYKVDEILSLQNTIIPRSNKFKQTVYMHQALPFIDYKFLFKENRKMWVYQNIIGEIIKWSIKKADNVIVQTNWMKESCILETGEPSTKFRVEPPLINIITKSSFTLNETSRKTFFYPAAGSYYKNHRIIIEACLKLKEKNLVDYKVIFTLSGDENPHIRNLFNISKDNNLPIEFIGKISKTDVFEYYSNSILLFPSYIESSPLPLSEGKAHETIIISSDLSFSKEILDQYHKKHFFDLRDSESLSNLMGNYINLKI